MKHSLVANLLILGGVASAQDLAVMKPNLELRLKPGKLLNGVPVGFTSNWCISDHDVHAHPK